MPTVPDQLLGPLGLLVASLLTIGFLARVIQALWKDHLAGDERARTELVGRLDYREQLRKEAVDGQTQLVRTVSDLTGALRENTAVMDRALTHLERIDQGPSRRRGTADGG